MPYATECVGMAGHTIQLPHRCEISSLSKSMLWQRSPKGCGHSSPLAKQGQVGGVVYADFDGSGSFTVSFEGCTIAGNNVGNWVSMKRPIIRLCMHASGSFGIDATAPPGQQGGSVLSCVSEVSWLDARYKWMCWG